jgi:UDP-N-acetylglucosamine/UDP-N-acetylgalactosamine diphosphorylase
MNQPRANDDQRRALSELLKPYGQEHLLRFWSQLTAEQRVGLAAEIHGVDFALIDRLYHQGEAVHDWAEMARRAEPPLAFRRDGRGNRFSAEEARRRGQSAMPQVAVLLVAGGQGTRLGFPHPKGMFPIGPVSGKTLFQILLEKILAVGRRYGVQVPLFIMTSPATDQPTREFLEQHGYFGLESDDVFLFCQGTMPAVDLPTGRLLLEDKHHLCLSPDGTGGMLRALVRSGGVECLRQRDIRHIFYMQVDNPLVSVCDAEFLGYHLLSGSELSTLVVAKESPLENLGNVVSVGGQVQILEYSDLNRAAAQHPELAERRAADGTPVFWAGNLGVHFIEVAFLERVAGQEDAMPFHVAKKKVTHIDPLTGRLKEPTRENAIKFERFVFDLLPAARTAIVVEVDKQTQFAPLKNQSGAEKDTPESVQAQMIALHADWLRQAGATLDPGVKVEISPLLALDGTELAPRAPRGFRVSGDRYLDERDAPSA